MVAGATGNLGQDVMTHLVRGIADQLVREKDAPLLAVLARDPLKAEPFARIGIEVRVADYDRPETLKAAFRGVRKLLLISTMAMNRADQQKQVVDAAITAGVAHIIYTGLAIHDIESSEVRDLMISHFQTEDHIRSSGVAYTFLRNTMYAEAIPQIISLPVLEDSIMLSGGDGRVPYASRAEMGEAAANVLLQAGHEGQTYQITGPAAWSYGDIAATLSSQCGRNISYCDIPPDTYRTVLASHGLPDFAIYLTLGTVNDIRNGQYDIESRDLSRLLGRPANDLPALLRDVFPGTDSSRLTITS